MEIYKSTCNICPIGCGVLIYVKNGRVIKIEPDKDHPLNKGKLCPKGYASLEYLYSPHRIKFPHIKRKNKFEKISWEDAFDFISSKLEKFSPEEVAFIHGAAKGLQDSYLTRFAYAFGSPYVAWQGHVCFVPRMAASKEVYGFYAVPDYDYPPKTIVVWGKNVDETLFHVYERILNAVSLGSKIIVVDPRKTELAKLADLHLQINPGTDLALAIGVLKTIVDKNFIDENFIKNNTIGFENFKDKLKKYSLKEIAKITGISEKEIEEFATIYAKNKPSIIQWGNAIDHGRYSFETAVAICFLRAVTGNIGRPGGEIRPILPPIWGRRSSQLELWDKIPENKIFKTRYFPPQVIIDLIFKNNIKAAYIQGANPILSYANAKKVYRALKSLDFMVVVDLFMTPTAKIADIILPSVTYFEFDSISTPPYSYPVMSVQQKVIEFDFAKSDYEILKNIADNLRFGEYFWRNEKECLNFCLSPIGITFDELKKIGFIEGIKGYTLDKKIDFSLFPFIKKFNFNNNQLTMISWKSLLYRHSGGRQIVTLRGIQEKPVIWINEKTAKNLRIKDGDKVIIETNKGKIYQFAKLTDDIKENVIGVDYAWWYPEKRNSWKDSNINILTDDFPPYNEKLLSTNLRNINCKIYSSNK